MRRFRIPLALFPLGWLIVAGSAVGQNAPAQQSNVGPIQRQWHQEGSAPVQQAPVSPNGSEQGAQTQGQAQQSPAAPPDAPEAAPTWANVWVPAGVAKLEALDKVSAQATALTIPVGKSATFGSLTITVKACMIRPPDQPADATAFLAITDSHRDSRGFDGWMLENEPAVSMMQNPIYGLRVTGCA